MRKFYISPRSFTGARWPSKTLNLSFKLTILILLSCVHGSLYAQNEQTGAKLPDVLPPSPSAFAITRYGGINLGLQTGTAKFSVPLFTLSSKSISVPISVSYTSNGIKVDELASRVGMSWALNAGGVITRTVMDQPDETSTKLAPPSTFDQNDALYNNFLDKAANSSVYQVDIAPDFFTFSFNGESGRFIMNSGQIVQLTKSNLKIEFNSTHDANFGGEFKITTGDGTKYFFGGSTNSIESSYSSTIGENCGKVYSQPINNAWYLTQILAPNGEKIDFKYAALSPYTYIASTSQTRTKSVTGIQQCAGQPSGMRLNLEDSNCQNLITTNAVYLTQIINSVNNYVEFGYKDRIDLPYDKLLSDVRLYQAGNPTPLRSFTLSYDNVVASSNVAPALKTRPFLTSISETTIGVSEKHIHSFEYLNPTNLPPRLSFSQDHYGYFNGANNESLIPRPVLMFQDYFPDATADRSPSFANGVSGILKKIIYPTGGYDEISYKAPVYTVEELPDAVNKTISVSTSGTDLSGSVTVDSAPFQLYPGQTAIVGSSLTWTGNPVEEDFHSQSIIYIINAQGNPVYTSTLTPDKKRVVESVYLPAGTYKLRCISYGEHSAGSGTLQYVTQESVPVIKNKISSGAVVDFVKTYDPVKQISSYKKYFYSKINDFTTSSGSIGFAPLYFSDYRVFLPCYVNNPGKAGSEEGQLNFPCGWEAFFKIMTSNSMTNIYSYDQHHITYQSVIESNGLNFENGGTEHLYSVEPNTPGEVVMNGDIIGSTYSNRGEGKNGLELFTNYFIKKGQIFQPVKQVTYKYKDDERLRDVYYGYTVRRKWERMAGCVVAPVPPSTFASFDVARNYIYSRWIYRDTVITQNFDLAGIPASLITEVTKYDNINHLSPSRTIIKKSDGSLLTTVVSYADDYASGTPFIDDMRMSHINGVPVERVSYITKGATSTVIEGAATQFKTGGKNQIDQLLTLRTASPKLLTAFKFSNAPVGQLPVNGNRTVFALDASYQLEAQVNAYDVAGNPIMVTELAKSPTVYIWSYNKQYPIAKVSNATYANVTAILGGVAAVEAFSLSSPTDAQVASFLTPLQTASKSNGMQVIWFTYDPLVGMTSQTDARGETTTYEYDEFQRLKTIRDSKGQIVKQMDYHYQNQ